MAKTQAKAAEPKATGDQQDPSTDPAVDPAADTSGEQAAGHADDAKAAGKDASAGANAARTLTADTSTDAAPLEPPEKHEQRLPHLGDPGTSTNPVAANSGLSSLPGADHHGLFNETGDPVPLDEVFDFPEQGSPSTLATVRTRVFEEFTYPNTTTKTRHLMYAEGRRIPVAEARRVIETYKHAEESELPPGPMPQG